MSIDSDESSNTFGSQSDEVPLAYNNEFYSEESSKENNRFVSKRITFDLYRRRYYMLGLFSGLHMMNQVLWLSLSTVENEFRDIYELPDWEANLVATLFPLLFLPGMILSTTIYNYFSLKAGIFIGSLLQATGAWLKCFVSYNINFIFIGQAFWALAQPFIVSAPTMVGTQWFERERRVKAITIGANANSIGIVIGLVLPTIFSKSYSKEDGAWSKNKLVASLIIQASVASILMLLTLFTFQSKPNSPPSTFAMVERKQSIYGSYRKLLMNWEFIKVWFSFGITYGNIILIFGVIEEVVYPFGITEEETAMLVVSSVLSGIAGIFAFGYYLKKSRMFKWANITICVSTVLILLLFLLSLYSELVWVVGLAFSGFGFWCFPIIILTYEYSNLIIHPMVESTSAALFILFSQIFGFLFSMLFVFLKDQIGHRLGISIGIGVIAIIDIFAVISAMRIKEINYQKISILKNSIISFTPQVLNDR